VRTEFREINAGKSRAKLGLEAEKPVVLVIGGSQGARGLNELIAAALPEMPEAQWMHLAGPHDFDTMKTAHRKNSLKTVVHEFFDDMPTALDAADLVISRAGASSLAEVAAASKPAVLVPLPGSADDHQRANARAAAKGGGAVVFEQDGAPEKFAEMVSGLLGDSAKLESMAEAMKMLDRPEAASEIAQRILAACEERAVDSGG